MATETKLNGWTVSQEILAPLHDAHGRFAKGNPGGPGRQHGEMAQATKQARQMILEALDMVGGAQYLALMAITQPMGFMALVGRTLPLKMEGDPNAPVFTIIQQTIVDPEK